MSYYSPRLIGGAVDAGTLPKTGLAICLVVLLALACAGLALGFVLFGGDVMEDIKRATVWVRVDDGESVGTGVIITQDGYILTSASVVKDGNARKIEVVRDSGQRSAETIIAQKTEHIGKTGEVTPQGAGQNYALIKIESQDPLPWLPVVDSSRVREGQKVFVAGFPIAGGMSSIYGPNIKIDPGHIGGIDRGGDGGMLSFNTDINPYGGMGGGPCTDDMGQVIGVTVMYSVNIGGVGLRREEGIYAIVLPTARFKHVWEPLMRGQKR